MNVNQIKIDQLFNLLKNPSSRSIESCTDKIIELFAEFPSLFEIDNQQTCHLVDKLFSYKNHLSKDKQNKIVAIFLRLHHLRPTFYSELKNQQMEVKDWVKKHLEDEAILTNEIEYGVPKKNIIEETSSCKDYFSPATILLKDGSQAKVSLGFLSHYSEMVQALDRRKDMNEERIVNVQLTPHQLDILIAFLETEDPFLINDENALSLLEAAEYLQILLLKKACLNHLAHSPFDLKKAIDLFNKLQDGEDDRLIGHLEGKIAQALFQAFKGNLKKDFLEILNLYRQNLLKPLSLGLSGSKINDEHLKLLQGIPIKKLSLGSCVNLSVQSLEIMNDFENLISLDLSMNPWVDNKALVKIPKKIKDLTLSLCTGFNGIGLAPLSSLTSLNLSGCGQLNDLDFEHLPDIPILNLDHLNVLGEQASLRLSSMVHLTHLSLVATPANENVIKHLPPSLIDLDLSHAQNLSPENFSPSKKLTNLTLQNTNLTDFSFLNNLTNLKSVNLSFTQNIAENSLLTLLEHPNLKIINLVNCDLDSNTIIKLKKKFTLI